MEINAETCTFEDAFAYLQEESIELEKKIDFTNALAVSNSKMLERLIIKFIKVKQEAYYVKNEELIKSELSKIVLPFQPFVKAKYNPIADRLEFTFDEVNYLAAAAAKTVPTFETEEEALEYLSSRKKTKCCGCEIYMTPRLFD